MKTFTSPLKEIKVICNGTHHISYRNDVEIHRWDCCCQQTNEVTVHPMPAFLTDEQRGSMMQIPGVGYVRYTGD